MRAVQTVKECDNLQKRAGCDVKKFHVFDEGFKSLKVGIR